MKKFLFAFLCAFALCVSFMPAWASVNANSGNTTPATNSGTTAPEADKGNSETVEDPTDIARKNTQPKSSSSGSSSVGALTSSLLSKLRTADNEIKTESDKYLNKMNEDDKQAQDLVLEADNAEREEGRTAQKYLTFDESRTAHEKLYFDEQQMLSDEDLEQMRLASENQGYRLVQTDRDAQHLLVATDLLLKASVLSSPSWFYSTRGWALKPFEFYFVDTPRTRWENWVSGMENYLSWVKSFPFVAKVLANINPY